MAAIHITLDTRLIPAQQWGDRRGLGDANIHIRSQQAWVTLPLLDTRPILVVAAAVTAGRQQMQLPVESAEEVET